MSRVSWKAERFWETNRQNFECQNLLEILCFCRIISLTFTFEIKINTFAYSVYLAILGSFDVISAVRRSCTSRPARPRLSDFFST